MTAAGSLESSAMDYEQLGYGAAGNVTSRWLRGGRYTSRLSVEIISKPFSYERTYAQATAALTMETMETKEAWRQDHRPLSAEPTVKQTFRYRPTASSYFPLRFPSRPIMAEGEGARDIRLTIPDRIIDRPGMRDTNSERKDR